jgi:cation transport ATPase
MMREENSLSTATVVAVPCIVVSRFIAPARASASLASKFDRRIALESVYAGIGLSFAGMIAAAFGIITPVQGAILQEIIDVTVILNALRALQDVPTNDMPLASLRQ